MALAQHKSIKVRIQQQIENAQDYLIPFIEQDLPLKDGMRVMEIGCGEGGVLKPFIDRGTNVVGVDLNVSRVRNANENFAEDVATGKAEFIVKNVLDEDFLEKYRGEFQLIMLKDTIEHIPDQENFIPYLKNFLAPEGRIFFGFPPWRMPFGGHQQICKSKFLGFLPWFHLLPGSLYRGVLRMFGENDKMVADLQEIKDTGISLNRFEKIIKESDFEIRERTHFLFNPIYKFKFGVTPRKQAKLITKIPFFRDFVTTAGWYLVRVKK